MNKRQLVGSLIIVASIIIFFGLFFFVKHADNSNLIMVNVGSNFTITLGSNPTTGYKWEIANPLDANLLEFINSKYIPTDTGLVGAPGKDKWAFKAKKPGKTIVSFKYVRPWEKDTPPVKTDYFLILINKRG